MLLISEGEQKRLNRLIRYIAKKERKTLIGCKDIFDVGKRYRCKLQAVTTAERDNISPDAREVRFITLPKDLQTKEIICEIEYHDDLKTPSEKAAVILELLKNSIDYAALCKRFHLQETNETKDYVSMRVFLSLFVSKYGGVKVVAT